MRKLSLQQTANILKVVVVIAWLLLMNSIVGCSSHCGMKKHWKNHRCVYQETQKDTQYVFANNQIVILR
jgi:hypothetical protein